MQSPSGMVIGARSPTQPGKTLLLVCYWLMIGPMFFQRLTIAIVSNKKRVAVQRLFAVHVTEEVSANAGHSKG